MKSFLKRYYIRRNSYFDPHGVKIILIPRVEIQTTVSLSLLV